LREFVEAGAAECASEPSKSLAIGEKLATWFSIVAHRAQFEDLERSAVLAEAGLSVENG
jgi:hypothetical protein